MDDPSSIVFPSALFVLPAVEIRGDGEDVRLTLRARRERRPGGATGASREPALRQEASRLAEALVEAVGSSRDRAASPSSSESVAPTSRDGSVLHGVEPAEREAWSSAVDEAMSWIRRGRISKVVLARILRVTSRVPLDPAEVVLRLWKQNPGTHVFLVEPEEGGAMVGAAPETIATVSDGVFGATAVAGSISRGAAPEEQEALALELLESEKDRVEHAIAVEDIVERLHPLTDELTWDSEPHVLTLSRIQHLETRIQARLAEGESVLSVLSALHPTPAVCGLPREAALDFLHMEEPFSRGWYAGPVGWFDVTGDGVFAPALRSALRTDDEWRLFAGAGIVEGSDATLEWEETRIKFEPVLRALEAAGAGAIAEPDSDVAPHTVAGGAEGDGGSPEFDGGSAGG